MYNSKILHSGSILTCLDTKNMLLPLNWISWYWQKSGKKLVLKLWVWKYFWCQYRLKLNQNIKFCFYTPNQTFKLVKKPVLSPKKARKMNFFQKFPREKVATPLKSFLGVIQKIWHSRNACDKKIIQHLLEAQCVLEAINLRVARQIIVSVDIHFLLKTYSKSEIFISYWPPTFKADEPKHTIC